MKWQDSSSFMSQTVFFPKMVLMTSPIHLWLWHASHQEVESKFFPSWILAGLWPERQGHKSHYTFCFFPSRCWLLELPCEQAGCPKASMLLRKPKLNHIQKPHIGRKMSSQPPDASAPFISSGHSLVATTLEIKPALLSWTLPKFLTQGICEQ